MPRTAPPPETPEVFEETPLAEALSARWLGYAVSTITARSLPDVRDGLKPVHRRLLHAMRELRLDPATGFKKCARIVGDVMGKYHPHGDQAIYDAMVRLAQDFAARWPLVDGQGNFGSVDGDNPAAMRYTEARMTPVATLLLDGLDEDAVDWRDTYDGSGAEPAVLPAAFPNVLANGATGIAVGMATSIPPHNVAELCGALRHLIKSPDADATALTRHVRGPDFPTGGALCEDAETIRAVYATGRGSLRLRARWHVEKTSGGAWVAVVTEIPWQTQKGKLLARLDALAEDRGMPTLAAARDESTEDIRIVLEPRTRTVDPEAMMAALFRDTALESRVSVNMNVLTDGGRAPRVLGLGDILRAWLEHRHTVLVRRLRHRREKLETRLAALDGLLICHLNLDAVIRIIREEDDPAPALRAAFPLTEAQAEIILNTRLRALRKLEEARLRAEHAELSARRADVVAQLDDPNLRWATLDREIQALAERFGPKTPLGRRRTSLEGAPEDIAPAAATPAAREPVTVVCSRRGWLRALKGHLPDDADIRYKDGDGPGWLARVWDSDLLQILSTGGRFHTLPVAGLPGGRGQGDPVRLLVGLPEDQDIHSVLPHDPAGRLLLASTDGRGFVAEAASTVAHTRAGRQALVPAAGAEVAACVPVTGDMVAVAGDGPRRLLVFPVAEIPVMARGRGVILRRGGAGRADGASADAVTDVMTFSREDGLRWAASGGRTRTVKDIAPWLGRRGQVGKAPPMGFPRGGGLRPPGAPQRDL